MTRLSDTGSPAPPPPTIEDAVAKARQLIASAQHERAAQQEERRAWAAVQKEMGALRHELHTLPEALGTGVHQGLAETLATLQTLTADLQAATRSAAPPPASPAGPVLALVGMIAAFFCGLLLAGPVTVSSGEVSPLPPARPPVIDPPARPLPPPPAPWSPEDLR